MTFSKKKIINILQKKIFLNYNQLSGSLNYILLYIIVSYYVNLKF